MPIRCDVASFEECERAAGEVAAAFGEARIAFLFANAGVSALRGTMGGASQSLFGPDLTDANWRHVLGVNVIGAVNTLRVFVPRMVSGGPLPSGRPSRVVTTSSVMGLFDGGMGLSAYNASKMACTAVCEMAERELRRRGPKSDHVLSHSLHPSMARTAIFGDSVLEAVAGLTAADVVDGMLEQMAEPGRFYLIIDDPADVPSASAPPACPDPMGPRSPPLIRGIKSEPGWRHKSPAGRRMRTPHWQRWPRFTPLW